MNYFRFSARLPSVMQVYIQVDMTDFKISGLEIPARDHVDVPPWPSYHITTVTPSGSWEPFKSERGENFTLDMVLQCSSNLP